MVTEKNVFCFSQFLKKIGNKPHVVDDWVFQVRQFEAYLVESQKTLDLAVEQDLLEYVARLESQKPGSARIYMRGVVLYYQYFGGSMLVRVVGNSTFRRFLWKSLT